MYMNPNKALWFHIRSDVRKSCLTLLNHTDFYQAGFPFCYGFLYTACLIGHKNDRKVGGCFIVWRSPYHSEILFVKMDVLESTIVFF